MKKVAHHAMLFRAVRTLYNFLVSDNVMIEGNEAPDQVHSAMPIFRHKGERCVIESKYVQVCAHA